MHHRAAGGAVLAGSDTFLSVPGLSLQRELVFFVDMGIPPLEAIRIATLDNAAFIGLDAELGSVEPGKRADLVVLDADPLADIANIASVAAVYRNGEPVDLRYHADHAVPTPRPPMVRPLWVERRLLERDTASSTDVQDAAFASAYVRSQRVHADTTSRSPALGYMRR